MAGFELQTCESGSNRYTNWATTPASVRSFDFIVKLIK